MGDPKDIGMVHFLCSRKFRGILCYIKRHTLFIPGIADKFMVTTTFFN